MISWEDYHLTEIPFREAGHIDPTLTDYRLNGKIFSKNGFEKPFEELMSLIQKEKSICYTVSPHETRGNGKSALLASVYWNLKKTPHSERFIPVWITVHDFKTITHLMSRILDTFVTTGIFSTIRDNLEELTTEKISSNLKEKISQPSPAVVEAVAKILSVPEGQIAWKYQNIRRSLPFVSTFEIFMYILVLYSKFDKRRIVLFIDQFEEYLEFQRNSSKLVQLAQDMKDIYRMCTELDNLTFVLTLHPSGEKDFQDAGREILNTYGSITENSTYLEPLKPKQLVLMAEQYLKHFHMPDYTADDKHYPFGDGVIEYVAEKSHPNCRTMIRLLHNVLMEAREQGELSIDMNFIKNPKYHNLMGLGILEEK